MEGGRSISLYPQHHGSSQAGRIQCSKWFIQDLAWKPFNQTINPTYGWIVLQLPRLCFFLSITIQRSKILSYSQFSISHCPELEPENCLENMWKEGCNGLESPLAEQWRTTYIYRQQPQPDQLTSHRGADYSFTQIQSAYCGIRLLNSQV